MVSFGYLKDSLSTWNPWTHEVVIQNKQDFHTQNRLDSVSSKCLHSKRVYRLAQSVGANTTAFKRIAVSTLLLGTFKKMCENNGPWRHSEIRSNEVSDCCASHTPFPRLCSHTEQGADIAFQRHHLLSSFLGVQHHCVPVEEESKRTMVCIPQTSCQGGNCPFHVQLTDQLDGRTYCNALGKRSGVPLEPVSGRRAQLREHMEKAYHPMWVSFLGQC